ncbi:MAG TPA: RHS repeat-associated core domain-containing protein, partial [Acidimicrobiales bacterium]|nr:RHS repeat-associated core domain-containing protein [Acidimicrobiales bacterium]
GLRPTIEMGARPYDPQLGRFLTIDPVPGGSANNYDYTNQNPIGATDLDGKLLPPDIAGYFSNPAPTTYVKHYVINGRRYRTVVSRTPLPLYRRNPVTRRYEPVPEPPHIVANKYKRVPDPKINWETVANYSGDCLEGGFLGAAYGSGVPILGNVAGAILGCAFVSGGQLLFNHIK